MIRALMQFLDAINPMTLVAIAAGICVAGGWIARQGRRKSDEDHDTTVRRNVVQIVNEQIERDRKRATRKAYPYADTNHWWN
jgi:hypothetical protein